MKNYHERNRELSLERKQQKAYQNQKTYKQYSGHKSPNPNKFHIQHNKNKNYPPKHFYKDRIKDHIKDFTKIRTNDKGEITGFTFQNTYYIDCRNAECKVIHAKGAEKECKYSKNK